MLVDEVEVYWNKSETRVFVCPRFQLLEHCLKQSCEEISSWFLRRLELRGTLKFSFDLEIEIVVEAIESVASQDGPFLILGHNTSLFVLKSSLSPTSDHASTILVVILFSVAPWDGSIDLHVAEVCEVLNLAIIEISNCDKIRLTFSNSLNFSIRRGRVNETSYHQCGWHSVIWI